MNSFLPILAIAVPFLLFGWMFWFFMRDGLMPADPAEERLNLVLHLRSVKRVQSASKSAAKLLYLLITGIVGALAINATNPALQAAALATFMSLSVMVLLFATAYDPVLFLAYGMLL